MSLREQIETCQLCPLSATMPEHPVPWSGPEDANHMLVGECPGKDEALLLEPFVGECGQFLSNTLKDLSIDRSSLYITNTLKCWCRNGNKNRKPTDEEIGKCKTWLWEEIKSVKPKVIMTLGATPSKTLLKKYVKKSASMGKMVGRLFKVDYTDAIIIPNYHPSYVMSYNKKVESVFRDTLEKLKDYD